MFCLWHAVRIASELVEAPLGTEIKIAAVMGVTVLGGAGIDGHAANRVARRLHCFIVMMRALCFILGHGN